jgi:ABC-type transporter MlaC component
MTESFQSFFKTLPGANPNMMEAMQQAISTANSAFEQIASVSSAAMNNVGEMAKKASGGAKRK